jgi:hypothetical protein
MSSRKPQLDKPEPSPARRVILRYKNKSWDLVRVTKTPPTILPASEPLIPQPAHTKSGAWYELVDGRGRLVYRCLIYNLYGQIGEGIEKGRLVGGISEPHDSVVSLLVPNLPDGGSLHLYSSPPLSTKPDEKVAGGARLVASFDLTPDEKEQPE